LRITNGKTGIRVEKIVELMFPSGSRLIGYRDLNIGHRGERWGYERPYKKNMKTGGIQQCGLDRFLEKEV